MPTLTYVYDDPDHPTRPTSAIQSPPYTVDDRALLAALDFYERGLCKCGVPRSVAWHSEMDGWWETKSFVCWACTAKAGPDPDGKRQLITYVMPVNARPVDASPLPPFVLGVTTSSK